MAKKKSEFQGEDGLHTVRVTHGYWKGDASVLLDGKTIFNRPYCICDFGFNAPFDVDGVRGEVKARAQLGLIYSYRLFIDGRSIPMRSDSSDSIQG